MNGKRPSSGPPIRLNVPGCPSSTYRRRIWSAHGTTSRSTMVRGSRRSWRRTRPAVASVAAGVIRSLGALDELQECALEVVRFGVVAELGGRAGRQDPPVAHQHEPVAAVGLVHDVARHEERRPRVRQRPERGPEVAAQHGVEADGRLVEHQEWRLVQEGGRQAHAGELAARQAACRPGCEARDVDGAHHVGDAVRPGADDCREVVKVLLDGQVEVDGRGLRHVADPRPERRRPRGRAEHRHRPTLDDLDPHDRPHQRRLPAAGWAEQACDLAGRHLEVDIVEHLRAAANDAQRAHLNGRGRRRQARGIDSSRGRRGELGAATGLSRKPNDTHRTAKWPSPRCATWP